MSLRRIGRALHKAEQAPLRYTAPCPCGRLATWVARRSPWASGEAWTVTEPECACRGAGGSEGEAA